MLELNKQVIGVLTGVIGSIFIGYCFYFDHKRRNAPDYKKKVHEKRKNQQQVEENVPENGPVNVADHKALQKYFLEEIQIGENLISSGRFEEGVEHFANAIVVCGQPVHLLDVLQDALPKPVFALLIKKMQNGSRPNSR